MRTHGAHSRSDGEQPNQQISMSSVTLTPSALPTAHTIVSLPGYGEGWERAPSSFADIKEYIAYLHAMTDVSVHGIDRLAHASWAKLRIFPIGFSRSIVYMTHFPEASAEEAISPEALAVLESAKKRIWAALIPGDRSTYIYAREPEYLDAYASSWYAHTWRKAGWDCNRHVEIMGEGTIPVFREAKEIELGLMSGYPVALLKHIVAHHEGATLRTMALWRHFVLKWTHAHLTSVAMARYMARMAGIDLNAPYRSTYIPPPGSKYHGDAAGLERLAATAGNDGSSLPRVAYINEALPRQGDFLAIHVLIGLTEWLGPERVDVFYVPQYMYARPDAGPEEVVAERGYDAGVWAKGFGYAHILPARTGAWAERTREEMLDLLLTGQYAAVVWGSFKRSSAHFEEAVTAPGAPYAAHPQRVWLVDGEDEHTFWSYTSESVQERHRVCAGAVCKSRRVLVSRICWARCLKFVFSTRHFAGAVHVRAGSVCVGRTSTNYQLTVTSDLIEKNPSRFVWLEFRARAIHTCAQNHDHCSASHKR